MDERLKNLQNDWKTHKCLKNVCAPNVNKLAECLNTSHKFLMSQESGIYGYLYQKQVEKNKELKQCLQQIKDK